MASYRELENDDFQLALKLLHSPVQNAKEEILKLVEKYSIPVVKPQTASSVDSSPIKAATGKRTANISDDSETDVEEEDDQPMPDNNASGCYICKTTGLNLSNSMQDSLMKCHNCSTHCHRECHKPTITKQEYDDPRFIWYCVKCNKTVKSSKSSGSTSGSLGKMKSGIGSSKGGLSSLSAAAAAAAQKRKVDPLARKQTFNSTTGSVQIPKSNPTNLSMNSVQQRIANRKVKK